MISPLMLHSGPIQMMMDSVIIGMTRPTLNFEKGRLANGLPTLRLQMIAPKNLVNLLDWSPGVLIPMVMVGQICIPICG